MDGSAQNFGPVCIIVPMFYSRARKISRIQLGSNVNRKRHVYHMPREIFLMFGKQISTTLIKGMGQVFRAKHSITRQFSSSFI